MLLVGNGVVRQGASLPLRDFCRQTGLHVITTFMGKGVIDSADEHFLFTAGLRAQDYPRGLMGRADLVVCVGYDMVEWPPSAWNPDGDRSIICIDTVPPEIDAHYVPEVELIGNLSHILTQLGCLLWNKPMAGYEVPPYRRAFSVALDVGADDDLPVKPQRVLHDLREVMAADDVLISDVGAHKLWIARFWQASEPNTVLISNGFAAMGFALPAAIAASLASRGRSKIVAVTGDGGFLMNVQRARDGQAPGPPLRGAGLDGRRLRPHRDAPAPQVRARVRHALRQPGFRGPRPELRHRGPPRGRAGELLPMLRRGLRHTGPVVVDIPIDYAENDKLGIDLWQLAPGLRG